MYFHYVWSHWNCMSALSSQSQKKPSKTTRQAWITQLGWSTPEFNSVTHSKNEQGKLNVPHGSSLSWTAGQQLHRGYVRCRATKCSSSSGLDRNHNLTLGRDNQNRVINPTGNGWNCLTDQANVQQLAPPEIITIVKQFAADSSMANGWSRAGRS